MRCNRCILFDPFWVEPCHSNDISQLRLWQPASHVDVFVGRPFSLVVYHPCLNSLMAANDASRFRMGVLRILSIRCFSLPVQVLALAPNPSLTNDSRPAYPSVPNQPPRKPARRRPLTM